MSKFSIKQKILFILLSLSFILLAVSTIITANSLFQKSYEEKITQVSYITEMAENILKDEQNKVTKGQLSLEDAQKQAIESINHLKFAGKNYIWINDYNYKFLAHPKFQGQDGSKIIDKNGFQVIVEATKLAKEKNKGVISYLWIKPAENSTKTYPKVSYIRNFADWNWVIGAGIYIDDIYTSVWTTFINTIIINIIVLSIIMFLSLTIIEKGINSPIKKLTDLSNDLANNHLDLYIENDENKTEIGQLNRSFKIFTENLKKTIISISETVETITASSEEMNASVEQTAQGSQLTTISAIQLAEGAQQISSNVEVGAVNITSLNNMIQEIFEQANLVSKLGNDTETNANDGGKYVKQAIDKISSIKTASELVSLNISELSQLSGNIEQIVDLIKSVAGQTNLLALNAAIEAARAGEHGKGFAVVAEEVKKLAEQSAGATDKITDMIKEIQNKTQIAVNTMDKTAKEVEEGVSVINNVGRSIENINSHIKTANENIQDITQRIDGVASSSEEIVRMIENISAITEETAASAQEISGTTEKQSASLQEINANAQSLSLIAEKINKQVNVFKM
ncbi:MAG: methyl-accepting chemotaxis protein [bacterium]